MKRNELDIEKYRLKLIAMRDRLTLDIEQMADALVTSSQAIGEHDRTESESADKDITLERTEEEIQRQVVDAMRRIEEGNYGKCENCGGLISKARLDALPHTPYCIDCERNIEKELT